jgi:hypothetical protein
MGQNFTSSESMGQNVNRSEHASRSVTVTKWGWTNDQRQRSSQLQLIKLVPTVQVGQAISFRTVSNCSFSLSPVVPV